MKAVSDFLASKKITANSLVSAWLFVNGLWYFSPVFKAYVLGAFSHTPVWAQAFVTSVVVPACIYWKSTRSSAS